MNQKLTKAEIYFKILEFGVENNQGVTLIDMAKELNIPIQRKFIERCFAANFQRAIPERSNLEMNLSRGQIGDKERNFLSTHLHYLKPEAVKEFLNLSLSKSMLQHSIEEASTAKKQSRIATGIATLAVFISVFGSIPDWCILSSTPTKETDEHNISILKQELDEIQTTLISMPTNKKHINAPAMIKDDDSINNAVNK